MNIIVQFMNKFLYFTGRNQQHTSQNVAEMGKSLSRIFSGSLIPKTSLILSVCMHLVGVSIIGLSSVKMTDNPGKAMQFDIFSVRSPKRVQMLPRVKESTPKLVHPKPVNLHRPTHQTVAFTTVVEKTEVPLISTVTSSETLDGIFALNAPQNSLSGIQHPSPVSVENKSVYVSSIHVSPQRTKRISSISTFDSNEIQLTPIPLDIPTFTAPTQNATFLKKIEPVYPESARLTHQQGSVVLEATIGVDGKAYDIKVVEVIDVKGLGCEEAAIQALKSSLFTPAMQGKGVVIQRLRIPYRFSLKG